MIVIIDNPEYTVDEAVTPNGRTVTFTYKPGSEGYNREQIVAKIQAALALLETADTNWASLTAGQKDAAQRLAVRVAAKLARLTLGQLEAN
jgi:hypothetical protein